MADPVAQKHADIGFHLLQRLVVRFLLRRIDEIAKLLRTARKLDELCTHLVCRDGEVDEPRGDGAVRHVPMTWTEAIRNLRDCQTTALLDGLETERAVAVSPGQYDTDRQFRSIPGKSAKEDVDLRSRRPAGCLRS